MIKEITIRNYKSIHDLTMELGHVNVLIGENGCGKTNILEAVAMLGAGTPTISIDELEAKGVRVTKPSLSISSFRGQKKRGTVEFEIIESDFPRKVFHKYSPVDPNDIFSEWTEASFEPGPGFLLAMIHRLIIPNLPNESDVDQKLYAQLLESLPKIEKLDNKTISKLTHAMLLQSSAPISYLKYLIFNLDIQSLRGINAGSKIQPLGIHGEGLDNLLGDFSKEEWEELKSYSHLISWLDEIIIDQGDQLKFKGHKLGRSNSILYFRDKFMRKNNNVFAAENSNEGVLHILFYLALFISKKTPKFFAIDNIETALNPKLCRTLMKELAALAVKHEKQALITTHNPAILDGMNLHDDTQRLFVISRSDEGHTRARRIKLKPEVEGTELKLSEMWMRGYLGGLPDF